MIAELIEVYTTFLVVGVVSSLSVVAAWSTFRRLIKW